MKKKILLFIAIVIAVFTLAIGASAASTTGNIDYDEKVTLKDGTVLPIYDANKNPLIWFISGTKDNGDETTSNVYSSIISTQRQADANGNYVKYNISGSYGSTSINLNQNNMIYYGGATYAVKDTVVVANLRGVAIGDVQGGSFAVLQYIFMPDTTEGTGDFRSTGGSLLLADYTQCSKLKLVTNQGFASSGLKEIRMPDILARQEDGSYYELTIKSFAFQNCKSLQTFPMPDNAVTVEQNAFQNCTALVSVTGGMESLKTIGNDTFYGCSALRTFDLSENSNLETIGARAFYNCSQLTAVYLPDTLEEIGNTTASNGGAFQKCTSLYFLNDPNEKTKPEIYYFPTSLTKIAGEEFSNCSSINNILVLPTGVTEIPQGYAFNNINGSSTNNSISKKYIVFLGNMTTVNLYTFNLDYVFVNPADSNCDSTTGNPIVNSATENVNMVMSKSGPAPILYFCKAGTNGIKSIQYWSNTWTAMTDSDHLVEKKVEKSPATCVDYAVYVPKCFCGKDLKEVKGTELDPDNHDLENATLISIVYTSYADNGIKKVACGRSCGENIDLDVAPIFVTKGYSIKESNGYGIMSTYVVNDAALKEYEDLNGPITFGIIMANANFDGQSAFMSKNNEGKYVLNSSYGVQLEIKNRGYSKVNATIDQFTQDEASLNLVMALYVVDGDKVSYIQHEGTYAGEITMDATLDIVTITNIADLSDIDLALPEAKALPVENKEN